MVYTVAGDALWGSGISGPQGGTMADPTAIDGRSDGRPFVPPLQAGKTFCARCAADVSALPPLARFCNRCGSTLPERFPTRHSVPAPPAPSPVADSYQPPLILLAYAKAMFNLGCRYETAIGSRRNLQEAARCYWKAARLGDPAAAGRLAPQAEAAVLPYIPPPLPTDPSAARPPVAAIYHPPAA